MSTDDQKDALKEAISPADRPPPMPGWVKAFGIVLLALILLAVIMMATGHHGPGRHMHFGGGGGDAASAAGEQRP